MGLRKMTELSPIAHYSSIIASASHLAPFVREHGTKALSNALAFITGSTLNPLRDRLGTHAHLIAPADTDPLEWFEHENGRGAQQILSQLQQKKAFEDMQANIEKYNWSAMDRRRVHATTGKWASAAFNAIPCEPSLRIKDVHYRIAVKLRLGLKPVSDLPALCVCGTPIEDDAIHACTAPTTAATW
jgi:hypothetical protein